MAGEISDEDIRAHAAFTLPDSEHQYTPLHWACYYGQLKTAEKLIEFGSDVNVLARNYVSPLHLAASGGHNEIVRMLIIKGAEVNKMDINGNTPLHYAAFNNFPHTTNELLNSPQSDILLTNEDNKTPYHLAIENKANLAQSVIENYIMTVIT